MRVNKSNSRKGLWNKGLTKDTCEKLRAIGQNISKAKKGHSPITRGFLGHKHTEEWKKEQSLRSRRVMSNPKVRASISRKMKGKNNPMNKPGVRKLHQQGLLKRDTHWLGRKKYQNSYGENFDSTIEAKISDFLHEQNIKFDSHKQLIIENRAYYPDFHILDSGTYLEFFGSIFRDIDRHDKKMSSYFRNNVPFWGLYYEDLSNLNFALSCSNQNMSISQIYYTVCGEGSESGLPAIFIRGYGCNRRCSYCDTKYSYTGEYSTLSIRNILDRVKLSESQRRCKLVFLTGGEITLQPNLLLLVNTLLGHGYSLILQTNGTQYLPKLFDRINHLLSVDVKGPSSGQLADLGIIKKIYRRYYNKLQLKFIAGNEEDFIFIKKIARRFPRAKHRVVSPAIWDIKDYLGQIVIGQEQVSWMRRVAEFCLEYEFRLSTQTHKFLWGQERNDV